MKNLFLIIFCLPILAFSTETEKSLLWKITSPKTEKTSYLYGTMHISGRLAFHLGEEFFESILEVDAIALESNPIIWLKEIFNSPYASDYLGKYGFQYQTYKGFYQEAFKLTVPDNKTLGNSIKSDHFLSNWMLYRENKSQQDFEEETFLDLFIYQTGRKNNKKVYSLENFRETTHLSKMGDLPDPEKKEKDAWYEELLEDKNSRELIEEAYRNKDVMFLDSIHSQINSDNFMKYMLEIRNDIMAEKIDSFIAKKDISLFIGIGAAHLGGEMGVIKFLQDKGYTVEPMSTTISEKAKEIKSEFDLKTTTIEFNQTFKSDLFSVKVPGEIYETPSSSMNQRQFFSPELTNGSYFSIKQISTYSYFSKTKQADYLLKIDSILFESIPGDIKSKKEIEINGFKGLDILNLTSNGNYQRYYIILTPINIFIFKMGGKKEFVKNQGDGFFESIQLTQMTNSWEEKKSYKNDFSIQLPKYSHFKNNNHITSLYGHIEAEGYDPESKNYYLVKRSSINDFNFIEEDNYELNRIADKFFDELDIDSCETSIIEDSKLPSAISTAISPKNELIKIKIIISGPFYYLLAAVSEDDDFNESFFNSFQLNKYKYDFPFEEKADSTLLFSVKSNYLFPTPYNDIYKKAYQIKKDNDDKDKEDESFKSNSEYRVYYSENYERVSVESYKYHNYTEYDNIDSLWDKQIRRYQNNKGLIIYKNEKSSIKNSQILNLELADTNSTRIIRIKKILKNGMLYTLKTNTDTISQPSLFVSNFFETFTPFDTIVGQSIFDDKSKLFLKNIYSEDSLTKDHALQSVKTHVLFDDEDFNDMKKIILNYPFSEKQTSIKRQMIIDIGSLENKEIVPFLENLYTSYEDTAMYQTAILQSLANQKSKKAQQAFLELLDHDIPLSNSNYGIYRVISPFYDSLEIAKELFPELLNFTFVDQYKNPTYRLLASMVSKNKIKGKDYKSAYKQILREAKISLKSQISYEQTEQGKESNSYRYSSYKNQGNSLLVSYCKLLIPFYKKGNVNEFFEKINRVQDYQIQTEINIAKVKFGVDVADSVWQHLAEDLINRSYLYEALLEAELLELFPKEFKTQNLIIESLLYNESFNPEKDSMEFIQKREVIVKQDTGYVYFYKSKSENDDDWSIDYIGLQPMADNEINIFTKIEETGIKIEKFKEIDEEIDEEIESIKLEGHLRAKKSTKGYDFSWFY